MKDRPLLSGRGVPSFGTPRGGSPIRLHLSTASPAFPSRHPSPVASAPIWSKPGPPARLSRISWQTHRSLRVIEPAIGAAPPMPKDRARLPGSISEERRRKLCRAIERLERGSTTGTPGEFDAWNFLRVSSGFRPRALVSAFEKLPASCPRTAWSLRRHERKVVTTSVITSVTMSTPTSPPTSPPASTTWAIECQVCR